MQDETHDETLDDKVTPTTHGKAVDALHAELVSQGTTPAPVTIVFTDDGFLIVGPGVDETEVEQAVRGRLLMTAAAHIAAALKINITSESQLSDTFKALIADSYEVRRKIEDALGEKRAQA